MIRTSGARNDNQQFLDYFFRFFDDVFFPYCEEHNIKTVIHLGDIMDRRKYVNFNTLNQVRTRFVQKLVESGMVMHCIPGNHDTFYKNTNSINCLNELFDHYDNIKVYEEPTTLDFDGVSVDLIPWINELKTMIVAWSLFATPRVWCVVVTLNWTGSKFFVVFFITAVWIRVFYRTTTW